jgi:hypothetical protein
MKSKKPEPKYDFGLSKKKKAAAIPRKKANAEEVLAKLAEMRSQIPFLKDKPPSKPKPGGMDGRFDARSAEEFELMAIADGLEAFADDLRESIEEQTAIAREQAMEVYYTAVELSQQPEHADLIPHVEAMRAAYIRDYGHPPPDRPAKPKPDASDSNDEK